MQKVLTAIHALAANYPGLGALDPIVVYLMACMKFDQFCCTWRALEDPVVFCPFCPTELRRRKRRPLSWTPEWSLFTNEFPRADTECMLLITPNRHIDDPEELCGDDFQEIGSLFRKAISGMPGVVLVARFGDPRDHAGTIEHLHFNVIRPTREGGCSLPVAKEVDGPFGHREDYARLHDFVERIDKRGGVDWLFSPEGVVETQPAVIE